MLLRITPHIWAHIRSDLRSAITGAHHELPEPQVRSFQPTRDFVVDFILVIVDTTAAPALYIVDQLSILSRCVAL